jgi:hypothetical protein
MSKPKASGILKLTIGGPLHCRDCYDEGNKAEMCLLKRETLLVKGYYEFAAKSYKCSKCKGRATFYEWEEMKLEVFEGLE